MSFSFIGLRKKKQGRNKGLQGGWSSWSRQSKERNQIKQVVRGHIPKRKSDFMGYIGTFKTQDNRMEISI